MTEKGDHMQQDAIVPIPPNRVKFFGTTGKMLLPSPETIANVIKTIPAHKLITTALIRQHLKDQFEVDGVCPVTTQKALRIVANDSSPDVAYWRVIGQDGKLIANFPGGVEGHAERLRQEGFTIDSDGKAAKVRAFRENLVRFA
jgi:hypothetical protein